MSDLASLFSDPQALELVELAVQKLETHSELEVISRLRKEGFDNELVRFAIEQAALRLRAKKKFGLGAQEMLFTEAGLEQATRGEIATWHASLLSSAGIGSVTDLGCGIGADSIAFSKAGIEVVAIEQHPTAFAAASHNLRGKPNTNVIQADAESIEVTTQAVYIDPARRDQNKKSKGPVRLRPEDFSPSLDFVFSLARDTPALVKLSPAFPHELIPADFEANWVSHQGDLVEVLLRAGPLAEAGSRKAVIVGSEHVEFVGQEEQAEIAPLGQYIFEPDSALVRSHLIGAFAKRNNLNLISKDIAYLTSDKDLETPWLKRYRVVEVLPLGDKEIRRYCADNNIGSLEIKKRGVDITPEALRPKLKLKGTGVATLILTKVGDARRAIVCESIR